MLSQTSLKLSLHSLFLPGLMACNHACEVPRYQQELFPDSESRNLKWDYDEITHKLIVNYQPEKGCELFRLKDDGFKVKSIIASVTRRI
ncbi:hypothetical protein [Dyadobacter diqingensis]|uniref:hypothetical protein n=1 Tax=Dyadobacter diqingensis TaxID=2938121 RepID=UPI0020C3C7FB|nr:hypothetical protein [Dyadobacter diqingensis]